MCEESTDAEPEEHVTEVISSTGKSSLNYVTAFANPVSGALSLGPGLEDPITLLAQDWANPSARLDLGLIEPLYPSGTFTVDRTSVLQPGFLDPVLPSFQAAPTVLLAQDFRLPPTAEDLARQVEKLSEEVKELKGKIEQQQQAESRMNTERKRQGRPPFTEADWYERFQLVGDIEHTRNERGISYEHACARHFVSYSTFRYWRQKMKGDK